MSIKISVFLKRSRPHRLLSNRQSLNCLVLILPLILKPDQHMLSNFMAKYIRRVLKKCYLLELINLWKKRSVIISFEILCKYLLVIIVNLRGLILATSHIYARVRDLVFTLIDIHQLFYNFFSMI